MIKVFCDYLIFIFGIFFIWGMCNIACEYRDYSPGHLFIKAFRAKSYFQRSLTLLQSQKDIDRRDLGKITYIGYIISLISTATAYFVIPFFLITYFGNRDAAFNIYKYWCGICGGLGVIATLLQGFDSLLNLLFNSFKSYR